MQSQSQGLVKILWYCSALHTSHPWPDFRGFGYRGAYYVLDRNKVMETRTRIPASIFTSIWQKWSSHSPSEPPLFFFFGNTALHLGGLVRIHFRGQTGTASIQRLRFSYPKYSRFGAPLLSSRSCASFFIDSPPSLGLSSPTQWRLRVWRFELRSGDLLRSPHAHQISPLNSHDHGFAVNALGLL